MVSIICSQRLKDHGLPVVGDTQISVVRDTRCLLLMNHFLSASFLSTYIFTMSLVVVLLERGVNTDIYKQKHIILVTLSTE